MFYVNSYVFAYKKEGIMYLRGRSMKELLEIEEVLGSKLTFEL